MFCVGVKIRALPHPAGGGGRRFPGVLIAEADTVRRAYPNVPFTAVAHLLWALHRAVAELPYGLEAAIDRLRHDIHTYPGDPGDLAALGVQAVFRAAAAGEVGHVARTLGELRLLRAEAGQQVYVLVGDLLRGRLWARDRHIPAHLVIGVRTAADTRKLLGLNPRDAAIVYLSTPRSTVLADALARMEAAGAVVRDRTWRPAGAGPDPDAGRPRADYGITAALDGPRAGHPAG